MGLSELTSAALSGIAQWQSPHPSLVLLAAAALALVLAVACCCCGLAWGLLLGFFLQPAKPLLGAQAASQAALQVARRAATAKLKEYLD